MFYSLNNVQPYYSLTTMNSVITVVKLMEKVYSSESEQWTMKFWEFKGVKWWDLSLMHLNVLWLIIVICYYNIVCRLAMLGYMFNFTVDDGLEDEEVNMRNGREKGELPSSFFFFLSHLYFLVFKHQHPLWFLYYAHRMNLWLASYVCNCDSMNPR